MSTRICLLACRAERARSALAAGPARFADVRWVAETGSTNADALALARDGAPEGIVLVADHQTAGRGRLGRTWEAPPGAVAAAVGAAPPAGGGRRPPRRWPSRWRAAEAVERGGRRRRPAQVAERPRVAGRRLGADRKLAGILAEADWPAGADDLRRAGSRPAPDERAVVVVGIGLNVTWPADAARRPRRHRGRRSTTSVGTPVDREDLLVALLRGSSRATTRLVRRRPDRRCSTSGAPARPRSAAGCGSTSAPTTSRAPPSTSPTRATSSSRRTRASRRDVRRRRRRPPPTRLRRRGATPPAVSWRRGARRRGG